jgi:hypothetical protein
MKKINISSRYKTMDNIDQHIQKDEDLLSDPLISPQSRRHTEEELEALKAYKANHPEDTHDPTALELYCDANPNALECRVYED